MECISCDGITDVIQRLVRARKISYSSDRKNPWTCVATHCIFSALCCVNIGVFQNVRCGAQVRNVFYLYLRYFHMIKYIDKIKKLINDENLIVALK